MAKEIRLRGTEGTSFTVSLEGEAMEIHLPLVGRQFVPNALSAVADRVPLWSGSTADQGGAGAFSSIPHEDGGCPLEGGATLINDAYNANPRSMEVALETLAEGERRREGRSPSWAICWNSGVLPKDAHEQLGKKVSDLSIDFLIAMGEEAPTVVESAIRHGFPMKKTRVAASHSEAVSFIRERIQERRLDLG